MIKLIYKNSIGNNILSIPDYVAEDFILNLYNKNKDFRINILTGEQYHHRNENRSIYFNSSIVINALTCLIAEDKIPLYEFELWFYDVQNNIKKKIDINKYGAILDYAKTMGDQSLDLSERKIKAAMEKRKENV
ncbi:MAG: hypothetical protein WC942_08150 [Clostridia bacterium]|jgi:hypothetical protein